MMGSLTRAIWRAFAVIAAGVVGSATALAAPGDIPTYHGDALRTGWNAAETALTPSVVGGANFGQLGAVALDAQVDAEPLFITGVSIAGKVHAVVYVATENDTVYAIDASNYAILQQRSLGTPVPMSQLPGGCSSSAATVGITGTPVIDTATRTLYVIAYTFENQLPVYRLHALDLATLADRVAPVVVAATQTLTNGSSYRFNPAASRQRAALLEANGAIYAGFASFCDQAANVSRGWILGWQAATLKPLAGRKLLDAQPTAPHKFFLTPVWMSGYGVAADDKGSLLFATGNSDPSGTTYNSGANLAESVVKLSADLTQVQSYFTPDSPKVDEATLDKHDLDFGSGGVMALPVQPGAIPRLAVAAGKVGVLYLMNRDSLGGFQNDGVDHVLGSVAIGACWCGPSYYQGADGVGRIVTSGGATAMVWKVATTAATPALVKESATAALSTGQDGGFLTSISSNGTAAHSQVIWAVTRPVDEVQALIRLDAFDPSTIDPNTHLMTRLFDAPAGTWPSPFANANIAPLVANHRVYVASFATLTIFGTGSGTAAISAEPAARPTMAAIDAIAGRRVTGLVKQVGAATMTVATRSGAVVEIETAAAVGAHRAVTLTPGDAVMARGDFDAQGVLRATAILRAKRSPALWPADR
jgi:hypothetical protein